MKLEVQPAYQHGNDLCLSFWSIAMDQGWIHFPPNASVLEIGCAEADWQTPMLALRPDLQIVGLDWRPCDRPGRVIKGNVMNSDLFGSHYFDAIVSVSAIEHVGLGAYEGDPQERFGDTKAMANAHRWLKPGGWMYLDVPYRPDGMVNTENYRGYDEAGLAERITKGWRVKRRAQIEADHPDSPYIALLLEKV